MITETAFGAVGGQAVRAFTITNAHGLRARVISYGARLCELHVPDRDGKLGDIVLGHDRIEDYVAGTKYFGATCGRYANRIAAGQLQIDGQAVQLDRNEGANHLHGGQMGFDRKLWTAEVQGNRVTFHTTSADGEMGYPGACTLRASYELTDDNRLLIDMEAGTSATTVINMVNHAYFNLAGQGSGPVTGQLVRLAAPHYTPVTADLLPTGELRSVAGTPFDFRSLKAIGQDMAALDPMRGYDHNWCLENPGGGMHDCAEVYDPHSGRRMTLRTSEPGVQFYTGGYIAEGLAGKAGARLGPWSGFTLETQKFPDSPNHPGFPSSLLRPGETYRHQMEFGFTA